MKNFNNFGVHWKFNFKLGGGFTKKQYRGGDCLKRGAWTVWKFKEEGVWQEREGGVFEGGCWYPDAHYGLFVLSSKMTNFVYFLKLFSGPKDPFSRKVTSYKSDSNTVVALFWKLESSLQKAAATQAIFKNESFYKVVMLVPKLVLSNILHSWKEKEFLNALETTRIVQPELVWNY